MTSPSASEPTASAVTNSSPPAIAARSARARHTNGSGQLRDEATDDDQPGERYPAGSTEIRYGGKAGHTCRRHQHESSAQRDQPHSREQGQHHQPVGEQEQQQQHGVAQGCNERDQDGDERRPGARSGNHHRGAAGED